MQLAASQQGLVPTLFGVPSCWQKDVHFSFDAAHKFAKGEVVLIHVYNTRSQLTGERKKNEYDKPHPKDHPQAEHVSLTLEFARISQVNQEKQSYDLITTPEAIMHAMILAHGRLYLTPEEVKVPARDTVILMSCCRAGDGGKSSPSQKGHLVAASCKMMMLRSQWLSN
ncbi:hypothetical protein GUITHDRAFT_122271 [Guillardia theta CCMP2712]|uniref:Uncharacterized protein n=1 Tax=Guillardia theta (strain CCMP2712) TaxID=905079 RepID=L1I5L4_GUITC|nr:hypothetical protein GUITHDRAFT_122271 [Guillardia theta CCMP2712]EKX31531.1 hypothetical protein GUITHDRAFT_122271 [Guillardia theta CCMP2712]|eukprot:XP_005818511.1 hypothetical protein GUITHDRAFT_122271 [Guillardia theta CCMP2712]